MAEFFQSSVVGFLLRAVDAFPVDRDRANRKTIRTAVERLQDGRVVGLFPEGGIRDGARSLLEGAPLRPGASTLAHIAGVPILPCVILGTDRLYSIKSQKLSALRRTPVWIAFGNPISHSPGLEKSQARERIESELASAFKNLYAELQQTFRLTRDDLPHSPRERMKGRVGPPARPDTAAPRPSHKVQMRIGKINGNGFHRFAATGIDGFLCATINFLHTRHRLNGCSRDEMERYVEECERLTAQQYYASPHDDNLVEALKNGRAILEWRSPIETQFASKQYRARRFFSFGTWSQRTDGSHFACADVHEPHRVSTLRGALQRTWLERMLPSTAIPLFPCPARLLERRACDHLRSHPQRRRIAARRNGAAPIDECIARMRLRRIRRARHELWRMDRCVACDGRARPAFRRLDGTDSKYRARDLGEPCSAVDPPRTASVPISSRLSSPGISI